MALIDQFLELVSRHHRILLVVGPIVLLVLYWILRAVFRPKKTVDAPEQKQRVEPQKPARTVEPDRKEAEEKPKEDVKFGADKRESPDGPKEPDAPVTEPSSVEEPQRKEASADTESSKGEERPRRSVAADRDGTGETDHEAAEDMPAPAGAAPEAQPEAEITMREEAPSDDDMVPERQDDHYVVDVFFATDRNRAADTAEVFTGDRHPSEALSFGSLKISVPEHHEVGEIEQPSWWQILLGFERDPNRFFTIQDIEDLEERAFFENVDGFQSARGASEAFIFIHGYNNSFVDAAFRTGQIAFDMRFRGAGILYSWPSAGTLTGYYSDAENARWTVPHLEDFLTKLAAVPSIRVLHLIAHSMGNQALAAALENLSLRGTVPAFNQIVLTAPDIDAGVFAQISEKIVNAAERVTLYASENDRALHASRQFTSYPRLGDISDGVFVLDGIDTIDASNVDTDILGHGYFAKSESILSDIDRLLSLRRPPGERPGLIPVALDENKTYWSFGS
ncbi:MAG: alpha/beta hydrolase [Methyloligellaceae bacterium]